MGARDEQKLLLIKIKKSLLFRVLDRECFILQRFSGKEKKIREGRRKKKEEEKKERKKKKKRK